MCRRVPSHQLRQHREDAGAQQQELRSPVDRQRDRGRDGDEEITAQEWAERLGTIGYEIVTGIGPRVPRRYVS